MPLKSGRSKATISGNIDELHEGPQYQQTKARHGKGTADRQAVAIALKRAGKSRKK